MTSDNSTEGAERGLYGKYKVYKDGEPVENCFVLEPESDPAARSALIEYARKTNDRELESDLREWLREVPRSLEADAESELTVTGVGSGKRRALEQAVSETDSEFPIRHTIDVLQVTEENVDELLEALLDVEQEMSECGAHGEAQAASKMYDMVRKQAIKEGLVL